MWWNLILKLKNKTEFIPVDSEHFTIWYGAKNNIDLIENIILTASGGPFINLPIKKFKTIKINQALKHPTGKWEKNFN